MDTSANTNVWRGVLIEEGFISPSILSKIKIVRTDMEKLEGEEGVGELHFHKVEVTDDELDAVVDMAMNTLRDSWYFHLVKDGNMKVLFHGKVFNVKKGDQTQLEIIRQYGRSQGILEEQIQLDRLFDNPYDEKD